MVGCATPARVSRRGGCQRPIAGWWGLRQAIAETWLAVSARLFHEDAVCTDDGYQLWAMQIGHGRHRTAGDRAQ
jgi:hypothetical protein